MVLVLILAHLIDTEESVWFGFEFYFLWNEIAVLLERKKILYRISSCIEFHHKNETLFVQRMGPQDVLPMCLPLKLIKNTGHRTLVIAFRNTAMQQGTCDYIFEV